MDRDDRIAGELKKVSKKIDGLDLKTPDLMTMVDFVSDEQSRLASRNNGQLALFSCTALAIIAVLILIYQLSAMVFVIIEGLLLIVPAVLLLMKRRGRNELT